MDYYDPYRDAKIEINITTDDKWTVSINGRPICFSRFAIDLDTKKAGNPTILLEVDPRLWDSVPPLITTDTRSGYI